MLVDPWRGDNKSIHHAEEEAVIEADESDDRLGAEHMYWSAHKACGEVSEGGDRLFLRCISFFTSAALEDRLLVCLLGEDHGDVESDYEEYGGPLCPPPVFAEHDEATYEGSEHCAEERYGEVESQ